MELILPNGAMRYARSVESLSRIIDLLITAYRQASLGHLFSNRNTLRDQPSETKTCYGCG